MKSWKIPTPDQVDRTIALIGHGGHYRYFFDRLENPEWIGPLLGKGFFQHPPNAEQDKEKGTIGFPPWPESRYLARMATKKPELVIEAILKMPNTDNIMVHEDLAEAALNMAPRLSAAWVDKEVRWVKEQEHLFFMLPRTLGKLIGHLARGGEVDAALDLSRVVFEVLPDPKAREKAQEDRTYSLPPQADVRFDQSEYEQILNKDIPELVKAAGVRAIELLCDLLEAAVRYSQKDGARRAPLDYSWIWRPAIEDHPQNRHRGLRGLLVTSLRDACESLIREEKAKVKELVLVLEGEKYAWHIFSRIALHLLRLFRESAVDLIVQRLTDYMLFDTLAFRHEYAILLNDCFELLSDEQQEIILGWIEDGPDLEEYMEGRGETTGKRPTEEDAQHYKKYWQRDRLGWFKTVLPNSWKKRYEDLVAEIGEPDHPDLFSYSTTGTWVGPTSPKSGEELQSMTVSEIVEFCKTWKPSGEGMAPSPEGLGRELSSVVSEKPDRFSEETARFQETDPTYVRALLSGFRDALSKGKTFDWQPVFDLCVWVVRQPREVGDEGRVETDKDPHWGWARKTIADFLSSGFEDGVKSIPFQYRKTVWEILQPLTEDPEPTLEYEAEYGDSNMDPSSLSINTTRGEAMHTVIRYALWVRRHIEKEADGKERLDRGFDEMPEVRTVLDAHLDILQDPSLAIRSVYGWWFPWLVLLDAQWAKENASKVFPAEEEQRPFCDAAWNAYITYCQAYKDELGVMEDQYTLAVDRLSESGEEVDSHVNPQNILGHHLMVHYWQGKLSFEDSEGLLAKFWEKASSAIRGSALRFVGRSLYDTKGSVAPEIIERMKALWEKRLDVAKETQNKAEFFPEIEAFGWWFVSAKFDEEWAIEQLLKALAFVQKTDPDHLVVERLVAISTRMPKKAVQCLDCLVRGDKKGWNIHVWIDEAKRILSHALQGDEETAKIAENLVHYLGSRGYLEFRTLLDHGP